MPFDTPLNQHSRTKICLLTADLVLDDNKHLWLFSIPDMKHGFAGSVTFNSSAETKKRSRKSSANFSKSLADTSTCP